MEKILLIDGHSILNRAFFGLPDLTNAQGLHTNAVYGFLNILFKVLEEEKPDYLTVTFDVHAPTFRHKLFDEYKGTRSPMAPELREQVPLIKEVLKAMGVYMIEQAGLEADDLLGTISRICEENGLDVSILSGDRDTLQLATGHVKIRIPKTKGGKTTVEDYLAADVKEAYGVTPVEFIDVKALMGDAADNIPGVPGIGEKTAVKLICEYGSIEGVYENRATVRPPRAAKNIDQYWEQAKLSKVLATIDKYADIPFSLEDSRLGELYTKEAYALFERLEFKNFLGRFSEEESPSSIVENALRITDREKAGEFFSGLFGQPVLGLSIRAQDTDTLPLFADDAGLAGAAFSFEGKLVYVETGEGIDGSWLAGQIKELPGRVGRISVCDLKEALGVFGSTTAADFFDPVIAAYLLNPLKNDYTAQDIGREHLFLTIPQEQSAMEACLTQAYICEKSMPVLLGRLEKEGMLPLFEEIEMPLVFTLYSMEQAGIKVKADELAAYGKELGERIVQLEKEIYDLAGEKFNINSPKQLGVILFEKLGMPYAKKTKTGYSTAADVLEKLAPDHAIVEKILDYRQLAKLKSTYADGLAAYIMPDGRIHGRFNQTITATGRISSTEPNLQNIPVRMELGRLIRKVFVPEDGYIFMDADYSQIELRILAHCSGDEKLIDAYRQSKDIHRMTASQVFHTPFAEVTDMQRRNAKAVNFGIVYGISSFGLSQDLSISMQEAAGYIDHYFETYPGVKKFLDETVAFAKKEGYVVTLYGRRRPVPELKSSNFMQRSFGERVAMNAPIQGTAADIIKIAMIGVDKELKERGLSSRLILQVHDELLIETKMEEQAIVKEIMERQMDHAAELLVPLVVDVHAGHSWYEAK